GRVFWASWLPPCSALALLAFVFGAGAWSALVFLVLYNAAHLACRVWALRAGWDRGMQVAGALSAAGIKVAARVAAPLAGAVLGLVIPLVFTSQLVAATGRARLM